jgi:hypothetical protein
VIFIRACSEILCVHDIICISSWLHMYMYSRTCVLRTTLGHGHDQRLFLEKGRPCHDSFMIVLVKRDCTKYASDEGLVSNIIQL